MRLFAVALTMAGSAAVVAQDKPLDHFHLPQACMDCHPDGVTFKVFADDSASACLQCHTERDLARGVESLRRDEPSAAESALEKFIPSEPMSADAGMRFPLYSPESRLGDAPNEMVEIPAGEFLRGTNERLADEGPQHRVDLPAFFIDRFEVTNAQYRKFVVETGRRSPDHFRNRTFPPGKADHPATFVTWDDAADYCAWAGKRLATDKEWEKAARGTDGRQFPWGEQFDAKKANTPVRWQTLGQSGDTTPVGAFAEGVSPFGIYDMTGNVWEWTASWYEAYPGNTTASESYGERYKTLKGGSWFDCSFYKCGISAPTYNRAFFAKRTKNDTFGFRCAKDV